MCSGRNIRSDGLVPLSNSIQLKGHLVPKVNEVASNVAFPTGGCIARIRPIWPKEGKLIKYPSKGQYIHSKHHLCSYSRKRSFMALFFSCEHNIKGKALI